jgi:Zn-dependent protease with chaperone function
MLRESWIELVEMSRGAQKSWMATAYQTFQAFVFHPDLGNEAVEGTIVFTNLSLGFRGSDAAFEIPISQLLVTIDHAGEGRITFHDSLQPELTITTSDMNVIEVASVPELARLKDAEIARLTRQEITRRVKMVLWFCAGCALVFWAVMAATGAMVRSIAANVPPEMEKHHGEALLDELKARFEFVEETNDAVRIATLAQPLLRVVPGPQEWQFHVITEDAPNAFAVPGGHIIVTRGLLKLCDRPEELLGVVAHEMAHLTHKHAFRQQISSAGTLLVLQLFLKGRGDAVALAAGGSALLVHQSFSQEFEKEADDSGWAYLEAANIDPRGMIEMLRKLKASEAKTRREGLNVPKAFSSHPDLDKRIARLEKRRTSRKSGFVELNWENPPGR